MITLEPVESSNIKARGYSEAERILAVEFRSGAVFHYHQVPPEVWSDWLEAISAGSFFYRHIKGNFPADPKTGDCPECGSKHGPIGTRCTDCGTADYTRTPAPSPLYPSPCCGAESTIRHAGATSNLMRCNQCGKEWRA